MGRPNLAAQMRPKSSPKSPARPIYCPGSSRRIWTEIGAGWRSRRRHASDCQPVEMRAGGGRRGLSNEFVPPTWHATSCWMVARRGAIAANGTSWSTLAQSTRQAGFCKLFLGDHALVRSIRGLLQSSNQSGTRRVQASTNAPSGSNQTIRLNSRCRRSCISAMLGIRIAVACGRALPLCRG